jgi:hypothetical protein
MQIGQHDFEGPPYIPNHSYDILGARMLWKPKKSIKFVKIRKNASKFVKICVEECYDKVLNEEF